MTQNTEAMLETVVGPTLIEMWAYAQLDEIIEYVSEYWLANDGGLTMAGMDTIDLACAAKDAIRRGDSGWITWDEMFDSVADIEYDIWNIVYRFFN